MSKCERKSGELPYCKIPFISLGLNKVERGFVWAYKPEKRGGGGGLLSGIQNCFGMRIV